MAQIVISGVRPWDGEYELDQDRAFNAREWRVIKKVAGYMPNTIAEGFAGDDPDLYVALAVVAMTRAGRVDRGSELDVAEQLSEAPFDGAAIAFKFESVEAEDPVPLAPTSPPAELSQAGSR